MRREVKVVKSFLGEEGYVRKGTYMVCSSAAREAELARNGLVKPGVHSDSFVQDSESPTFTPSSKMVPAPRNKMRPAGKNK
jgi:hypothetical protein